jgi:hypothetical protein
VKKVSKGQKDTLVQLVFRVFQVYKVYTADWQLIFKALKAQQVCLAQTGRRAQTEGTEFKEHQVHQG